MKIAIIVILVLIVAVIAFVMIARRRMPRMQHYYFAHEVLPSQLFADPSAVIIPLIASESTTAGGRDLLLALWNAAGEMAGNDEVISPDGLEYSTDVFGHPNATACLIHLPAPLKKPEAYFAAIVFDGPGLAAGTPRLLRYFVLEHHGEKNGTVKTLLGEWSPKENGKLDYSDHGWNTPPTMTAFTSRVREVIEKSGSMPVPVTGNTSA